MAGWILGLETSGRGGSVAISDGIEEHSIDLRDIESGAGLGVGEESGSAKFLAPAIESLMERYRRDMADLRAIAVTVGPGSVHRNPRRYCNREGTGLRPPNSNDRRRLTRMYCRALFLGRFVTTSCRA